MQQVIIVENNGGIRQAIAEVLEDANQRTTCLSDADSLAAYLSIYQPDALIVSERPSPKEIKAWTKARKQGSRKAPVIVQVRSEEERDLTSIRLDRVDTGEKASEQQVVDELENAFGSLGDGPVFRRGRKYHFVARLQAS